MNHSDFGSIGHGDIELLSTSFAGSLLGHSVPLLIFGCNVYVEVWQIVVVS